MSLELINCEEVKPDAINSYITLDGRYFIDTTTAPIRIRNIEIENNVDTTYFAQEPLQANQTTFNGVEQIPYTCFNCFSNRSANSKGQSYCPVMVTNGLIYTLTTAALYINDLNTGALVDSPLLFLPVTNSGLRLQSLSVGFIDSIRSGNRNVVAAIFGIYYDKTNPNSQLIVSYKHIDIIGTGLADLDFPANFFIANPLPGQTLTYSVYPLQVKAKGCEVAIAVINQPSGIPQMYLAYFGSVTSYLVDGGATFYQPSGLPGDLPSSKDLTDSQIYKYTGWSNSGYNQTITVYPMKDTSNPPNGYFNSDACISNFYQLTNNLQFPILTTDVLGDDSTIEYSQFYKINSTGELVRFQTGMRLTPFVYQGGLIEGGLYGILATSVNGKVYNLNSMKGGNEPVEVELSKPTMYNCNNYTRLI